MSCVGHDFWYMVYSYLELEVKYSLPIASGGSYYKCPINDVCCFEISKDHACFGKFLFNNITHIKLKHPIFSFNLMNTVLIGFKQLHCLDISMVVCNQTICDQVSFFLPGNVAILIINKEHEEDFKAALASAENTKVLLKCVTSKDKRKEVTEDVAEQPDSKRLRLARDFVDDELHKIQLYESLLLMDGQLELLEKFRTKHNLNMKCTTDFDFDSSAIQDAPEETKTKAKFIKEFTREVEANEPRITARKVAQERNNTYLQAQLLGATFTRQGLDEFEQEYTNNINPRSTDHHSPQASGSTDATDHHSPQASGSTDATDQRLSQTSSTTPTKKTCT